MLRFEKSISREWLSPPGDTIREIIAQKNWTQKELSGRMGVSPKHINQLIHGKVELTVDMAHKLEKTLGSSVKFWLNREANYRELLYKIEEEENRTKEEDEKLIKWCDKIPIKELQKNNYLPTGRVTKKFKLEIVPKLLTFFAVSSLEQWELHYLSKKAFFRRAERKNLTEESIITWLRLGEIEFETNANQEIKYNEAQLLEMLPSLRQLTRKPIKEAKEILKDNLQSCGIELCFTEAFSGLGISGCVRWMSATKPLIQMTTLGKSHDRFWFSLFHELAHIVLHSGNREAIYLEDTQPQTNEIDIEKEADSWASEQLIPSQYYQELQNLSTESAIKDFAKKIKIAPGIVVGRMQHENLIPYTKFNSLKERFID